MKNIRTVLDRFRRAKVGSRETNISEQKLHARKLPLG
jgi:hypothetical protein